MSTPAYCVRRTLFFYRKAKTVQLALVSLKGNYGALYLPIPVCDHTIEKVISRYTKYSEGAIADSPQIQSQRQCISAGDCIVHRRRYHVPALNSP